MLGKLFKHDMRALSRPLIVLHLVVAALGVAATLCGLVGWAIGDMPQAGYQAESFYALVMMGVVVGMLFSVAGVLCAPPATLVIIVHRFYRSLFTDEGYLSFTLPVPNASHLLSKMLAGLLWLAIDFAVVFVCALSVSGAIFGFGAGFDVVDSLPMWLLSATGVAFGDWQGSPVWGFVQLSVGAVSTLAAAYLAFTLGSVLASRHRVAAGIGLFALITWGSGLVLSLLSAAVTVGAASFAAADGQAVVAVWRAVAVFLEAFKAAALLAICAWLLNRKVDLP